jgi:hypothetical protein
MRGSFTRLWVSLRFRCGGGISADEAGAALRLPSECRRREPLAVGRRFAAVLTSVEACDFLFLLRLWLCCDFARLRSTWESQVVKFGGRLLGEAELGVWGSGRMGRRGCADLISSCSSIGFGS